MSIAREVLREFVISIVTEVDRGLHQRALKSVDEVTTAIKKHAAEEKKTTEDSRRLSQERVRHTRQMGEEISIGLRNTVGNALRTLTFQITGFIGAFAGLRAVKNDIASLAELDRLAKSLSTTPTALLALQRAFEDLGGKAEEASGAIQAIRDKIRENPGFKTFLRDSLGVTEFDDYSKTIQQIGVGLRRIAQNNEALARQYGQLLGLSQDQTSRLISPKLEEELSASRRILEQHSQNLDREAAASRKALLEWGDFVDRLQAKRDQLAGAIARLLTPIITHLSDVLDENAPKINRNLEELLRQLTDWGNNKGRDFILWLEKITDPANDAARREWTAFFVDMKKGAIEVKDAVGEIIIAIKTGLELLNTLRVATGGSIADARAKAQGPLEKSLSVLDPNFAGFGNWLDKQLGTRYGQDEVKAEADKRLETERKITAEAEKRADAERRASTGGGQPGVWQRFKNWAREGLEASNRGSESIAGVSGASGTFGSMWERLFGGAGGGGGGIAGNAGTVTGGGTPAMGGVGPAGRGAAGGQGGAAGPVVPANARTAVAMRVAMDQLRKEGVPEANVKAAAAHLVGQAQMESGLDPTKTHDQGTGYGIYGARDDPRGKGPSELRRSAMFAWLAKNGYDKNSLEGQTRFMAHEAMTGSRFGKTRDILMNANASTFAQDVPEITRNFEAPAVINYRTGAVQGAFGASLGSGAPGSGVVGDRASYIQATEAAAQAARTGGDYVTSTVRGAGHNLSRANPRSAHVQGLAFDIRARTTEQVDAAMARQRERFAAMGLKEGQDYKFKDEVRNPARHATGPHLHVQLTPEGASRINEAQGLMGNAQNARNAVQRASNTILDMNRPKGPGLDQVGGDGARGGTSSVITNGPTSNDNSSRVINFKPQYNTKISANDTRQAASTFHGVQEDLTKASLRQLMPNVK